MAEHREREQREPTVAQEEWGAATAGVSGRSWGAGGADGSWCLIARGSAVVDCQSGPAGRTPSALVCLLVRSPGRNTGNVYFEIVQPALSLVALFLVAPTRILSQETFGYPAVVR